MPCIEQRRYDAVPGVNMEPAKSLAVACTAFVVACTSSQPKVIYVDRPVMVAAPMAPAAPAPATRHRAPELPDSYQPVEHVVIAEHAAPVAASIAPAGHASQPSHPLGHCTGQTFDSGWRLLHCGSVELQVYAGFAATPGAAFLREVTQDRLDTHEDTEVKLQVAGKTVVGWEMTARERKTVEAFFGVDRRWDPTGRPTRRALFAKIQTPRSGTIGVACHASPDVYRRSDCHAMFETIAKHDLPTGPAVGSALVVAGVRFDTRGVRCWSPEPENAYCEAQGYLSWNRADRAKVRAWIEERIRTAPLAPRTDAQRQQTADSLNSKRDTILRYKQLEELRTTGSIQTTQAPSYTAASVTQYRMTRHPGRCVIAGAERDCERVDYYGALDRVAERQYFGFISDGATATAFECLHNVESAPSTLCRQVFGSFLK
jgi:hypothetical protein